MGPDLAGPTPITLLPPFRAARPRAAADPTHTRLSLLHLGLSYW
jgi:hypothetical protein